MTPLVSIIMGSTSDLPVMEKAMAFLNEQQIPFEVNALSAHRTPDAVENFARNAEGRGIRVIIAAAGMAAALGPLSGTAFHYDPEGDQERNQRGGYPSHDPGDLSGKAL